MDTRAQTSDDEDTCSGQWPVDRGQAMKAEARHRHWAAVCVSMRLALCSALPRLRAPPLPPLWSPSQIGILASCIPEARP